MQNLVLHKVNFTAEAVFDYEFCLIPDHGKFDESDTDWNKPCIHETPLVHFRKVRNEIKQELEEYIQRHSTIGNRHYFRVRHYDEQTRMWLTLFVKRSHRFANMQTWDVVGIIDDEYFSHDDEEFGVYREWYDMKFDKHQQDIVLILRLEHALEMNYQKQEEVWENEYKLKNGYNFARRFESKERIARVSAQLGKTRNARKQLESDIRILESRLRDARGKTRIY